MNEVSGLPSPEARGGLNSNGPCARVPSNLLIPPKFPEELWTRLKTWANARASSQADPSLDDCERYLYRICSELAGDPNVLPAEAAAFYARETIAMIAKFRAVVDAEGGVA